MWDVTGCLRPKMARIFMLINLVILVVNVLLMVLHFDANPITEFFADEAVTAGDRRSMLEIFSVLVATLDAANVTYFMYGGTLIGSVRHHGPIPWDDDVDVIVATKDREVVRTALADLYPSYELYKPDDDQKTMLQWKLYSASGHKSAWTPKPYRWPFVDIFFFDSNETHIWDLEPEYHAAGYVWPKNIVFPLSRRPFGGTTAPAPCNSLAFVMTNYAGADSDRCTAPSYNHRIDMHRPPWRAVQVLPCARLWHVFPFVFRSTTADGGTIEMLKIGNWTLQTVSIPNVVCSGLPPEK